MIPYMQKQKAQTQSANASLMVELKQQNNPIKIYLQQCFLYTGNSSTLYIIKALQFSYMNESFLAFAAIEQTTFCHRI